MRIVAVLMYMTVLVSSCDTPPREQQPLEDDPYRDAPLHVSTDITVRFYDSVRTRANLESGTARLDEDRRETTLGQGVTVVFYDQHSGKQAARLTSDSAIVDDRSRDMIAIGNVVVYSDSSKTTLRTERLVWEQSTELIRSDADVNIRTPTETIEGQGFVSDQLLTSYRIFKVRGVHQK